MADEYESLNPDEAKAAINNLARNKAKLGHNVKDMIDKLISLNVLSGDILSKTYDTYGTSITGANIIEVLESAYLECRYPIPDPAHKKYPLINEHGKQIGYWDPIASSEPKVLCL